MSKQQLSTNTFTVAKWVVSADATQGTHTTIQGAINSASNGDSIDVRDGTYTEDLIMIAGINITGPVMCGNNPTVTIIGKITATYSGYSTICNCALQTNADYFLSITGSNSTGIGIQNCYLVAQDHTGINVTSSGGGSVSFFGCHATINTTGIALFTTSAGIGFQDCILFNFGASTTPSTVTGGTLFLTFTQISLPISISSTGNLVAKFCEFNTTNTNAVGITTAGSGATALYSCMIFTNSGICITSNSSSATTVYQSILSSTATNIITGSGPVVINGNITANSGLGINVTSISGVQSYYGTGSPNASLTAPKGSVFYRTDGSTSITRGYINTDGSTTWTAITTVA